MEKRLIQGLINDFEFIHHVKERLTPDDFTDSFYGGIFKTLLKVFGNGYFDDGFSYLRDILAEEFQKEGFNDFTRLAELYEPVNLSEAEIDSLLEKIKKARLMRDGTSLQESLMTGVAGDFARLYSRYMEAPSVFLYFSFLTILGSILSDRLTIASELRQEPRLYILLIGESGDDRKSTAMKAGVQFFTEHFKSVVNFCYGVGSEIGLMDKFKETDGRLLLIYDEMKALVGKSKIEGSILLPFITSLFEDNHYESRTKTRKVYVDNAHLSLLGATTSQTHESMWTSSFLDIGLINRIFIVPGTGSRKHPVPQKIPSEEKMALAAQTAEILKAVKPGTEIDLSDDALQLYSDWYLNIESGVHAKRIETYAARLMPLIAVNEGKSDIDVDVARTVTAICDWQLMVREQLDPIDASNKIARMEEKIRRKLKLGPRSKRTLMREVNYQRDGIFIFETALRNLKNELLFDRKASELMLK